MKHIQFFLTFIAVLILTAGPVDAGTGIPRRVVSLSPIVTETIFLLGAEDLLVADTTYCSTPEAAKKKEKIGTVTQMNIEKILSLRPDLVISGSLSPADQLRTLEHNSIEVFRIQSPKTFSGICDLTLGIGRKLGKEEAARKITARVRQEVEDLQAVIQDLPKPKIFFQLGANPLHAVSQASFMDEYIRFSRAVNIMGNDTSAICSLERVVAENPDLILIALMGTSQKAAEAEKEKWAALKNLKAAKQNRIVVANPEMICSPTPASFVSGLKYLLPLIHPEMENP
ncbi:MAG: hypothetical protein A2277_09850 [Desulfobacterales bacterium RIFOXYA12_FULL_46_15]|nr:MAG: hypothetical protein A2277_09850 [Desulfobacterales bacterium RIFOXYA12_FULL_46_15]